MARMARVIASGIPHHVTQRGNRRQQTIFCDDDYLEYLSLMAEWCGKCGADLGVVPYAQSCTSDSHTL